jgi:hypothetical protein
MYPLVGGIYGTFLCWGVAVLPDGSDALITGLCDGMLAFIHPDALGTRDSCLSLRSRLLKAGFFPKTLYGVGLLYSGPCGPDSSLPRHSGMAVVCFSFVVSPVLSTACGGVFLAMSALASVSAVISSACTGVRVCSGFEVLSISVELVVASLGMAKGFVLLFCFFAKCRSLCRISLLLLKPAESSKKCKGCNPLREIFLSQDTRA